MFLEVFGSFILSVLVMAIVEYVFHRFPMHRYGLNEDLFDAHARLHHGRYYRETFEHDPDPAARRISMRMSAVEHFGASLLASVPLWLWVSPVAAVVFSLVVVLHALIWTATHVEMHCPEGRFFSNWWVYRYIRAYHTIHHLQPGRNFAAVFPPLMDWICGTYVKPEVY